MITILLSTTFKRKTTKTSPHRKHSYLLHKRPELSKLLENRFVGDGADVLNVVEGLSLLVSRGASKRFSRIYAFEDAEPAKVLQGDLEQLEALGSADEGRFQPGVFLLLLLSHPRKLPLAPCGRA